VRGRGRGREGSRDCNERREQRREHGVEIWSKFGREVADKSKPETALEFEQSSDILLKCLGKHSD
jgi:hypothetical protein